MPSCDASSMWAIGHVGVYHASANYTIGLALLEKKATPIEKYQYLSVLRNTDVHLFYRLLAGNIKVRCLHSTLARPSRLTFA